MKKNILTILTMVVVLTMTIALVACNNTPPPADDTDTNVEQNEEQSEIAKKMAEIYADITRGAQDVPSVQHLATLTSMSYTIADAGPIAVAPATLNDENITLIMLSGTEFKEGQATTIKESQLASMGKTNDYLKAVLKLFNTRVIPKGKPVLVTGISLGGMIAQQLLGETGVMNNYDIRAIVTFGSPITLPFNRHGVDVVRFADVNDEVPKAGEVGLYNARLGMSRAEIDRTIARINGEEVISEVSKYRGAVNVHALSYLTDECWDKYDILGEINGTAHLVITDEISFYDAPTLS